MKNLKEKYMEKANSLFERLLDEQPEDEDIPTDDTGGEETVDVENEPEQGQSEQVDVFFDNLDEGAQKVLLDALKENLNVSSDDKFAHEKIVAALTKEPLVSFRAEELVRKLNLDI